jgi:hypothetical protein
MIPSKASFAEWFKVAESVDGDTFYIDTKIRKHDGHIYYWDLSDYLKPSKNGVISAKTYYEADCGRFRSRQLQASYHPEPMGKGAPSSTGIDESWYYPSPRTIGADILEAACALAD